MYLWRKTTTEHWLQSNEDWLSDWPPGRVAIVRRPGFKRLSLEITGTSAAEGRVLRKNHGGTLMALKRNWLQEFAKAQRRKPLRIGKRLIIRETKASRDCTPSLVIPSGAAFGTGDHATTAMTLRMLERQTRRISTGWSIADLGTGSGILSLAAFRFGARHIEAIDNDPIAISTAKENARLNQIRGIGFAVQDVKKWRPQTELDVVVANLFSQLLIAALPVIRKCLKPGGLFIFSGVMRTEEEGVVRAIRQNGLQLEEIRRRGKWIALAGRKN